MQLSKRHFLNLLAISAAMPVLINQPLYAKALQSDDNDYYRLFNKALKKDKRLTAIKGVTQNTAPTKLESIGTIPPELYGTFYRNGPAKNEFHNRRYTHWFDGDGMIHAFRLSAKGAQYQSKFIETDKYQKELAADKFFLPSSGTIWADKDNIVSNPDAINTANINLVWHGNELLALWEGGSAHRINPDNLATLGKKIWRDDLNHLPFSAHPRTDENGDLWNFGSAAWMGKLLIYRINPNGELIQFGLANINADAMIHDFAITKNYLIFIMPPLRWQKHSEANNYVDRFKWHGNQASRVVVLDKNDFSVVKDLTTDTGFHFHLGNAYEYGDDIMVDFFQAKTDYIVSNWMRDMMRGALDTSQNNVSHHRLLRINLKSNKTNITTFSPLNAEFPTLAEHKIGKRNRFTWMLESADSDALLHRITKRDMKTGKSDMYDYGKDMIVEEHIFVPNRNSKNEDGWLIGTAFDVNKQSSLVSIFDAQKLQDGAIFRAYLNDIIPLGFHGHFVAQDEF